MKVTTITLEMLTAPVEPARGFPTDVRLDRAASVSPEYARFLYGLVGGPWSWTDRLGWSRQQWLDELSILGTEFWILYGGGVPLGYVHLCPSLAKGGTEVELRYFGLTEQSIGRGLGGRLLEHGIRAAWSLSDRFAFPAVTRVWVHTCTLDGPAALANYQNRGLVICAVEENNQTQPDLHLGSWVSTGGPATKE
jgi:GNAT superfamily N-acetyltransferase